LHSRGEWWADRYGDTRGPPLTHWIFVGDCALLDRGGNKYYPVLVGGVWFNAKTMKRLPVPVIGTPLQMTRFTVQSVDELDRLKTQRSRAASPDGAVRGGPSSSSSSSSSSDSEYDDGYSDEFSDGDDVRPPLASQIDLFSTR
jgi:hypothetical protein